MFYDFIYLAKGFRMRPKVRSTLNADIDCLSNNRKHGIILGEMLARVYGAVGK